MEFVVIISLKTSCLTRHISYHWRKYIWFIEWMIQKDPTTMHRYTSVQERDIFDFTWKYDSNILSNSVANPAVQETPAYTDEYAGAAW